MERGPAVNCIAVEIGENEIVLMGLLQVGKLTIQSHAEDLAPAEKGPAKAKKGGSQPQQRAKAQVPTASCMPS